MNDNTDLRLQKSMPLGKIIKRMLLYFVVFDICLLILYPYFVMFCTALKSRAEIFSIEGTILRRNKPDTRGKHPWKAEVTEGDTSVTEETIVNWYNEVYEPAYTA